MPFETTCLSSVCGHVSVFSHKIKFFFAIQEVHWRCTQQTCLNMLFLLYHSQNPIMFALLVVFGDIWCPPQLESVRWAAQALKWSGLIYLSFLSKLILHPHSCPDHLHSTKNQLQFPHSVCTCLMSLWIYWMTGNLLVWGVWYLPSVCQPLLHVLEISITRLRRVFTASAVNRGLNSIHC